MLSALSSGLPISAKGILESAMKEVFDGGVTIQELNKENLRTMVRFSAKNHSIVLVVLDGVSHDICNGIENGLYSSDKYYTYINDKEFVDFLNKKYKINLEYEEEVLEDESLSVGYQEEISGSKEEMEELDKYYQEKLQLKDSIIKNLEARVKDVSDLYGELDESSTVISSEELDTLRNENISLNDIILGLKSDLDTEKAKAFDSESRNVELIEKKANLEKRINGLSKKYDECLSELNSLKVAYSKQSGIIRDKESEIEELQSIKKNMDDCIAKLKSVNAELAECKKSIQSKDSEIGDLKVDVQSRDRDIARYLKELESMRALEGVSEKLTSANTTIDSLNKEISSMSNDISSLSKDLKDKDRLINQLTEDKDNLSSEISNLEEKVDSLTDRIKVDTDNITQLNKEKLELQTKVSLLEKESDTNDETDDLIREIQDLQNRLTSLKSSVFTRIAQSALPRNSVGVKVLNGSGTFRNIRFTFAGNAESRKGTYKCLLNELRNDRNNKYLLVDLVSETSVDYVFEIRKITPGIEWFRVGGSVQPYITNTVINNIKVLSPGLGYVNDSYFLCIDWVKRLLELDNCGYKVIVFCGDISNLVGRVLHESFASYGESTIYVQGNAIGCRTVLTNLRGLSNSKDSMVAYYEFNPDLSRFYDLVAKDNECKVLSRKGTRIR